MREIKFRAWDTKTKQFLEHIPECEYMIESDCWDHHDMDEMGGIYPATTIEHFKFNGRIIWQQYTGLKDKNGAEIYEGDILKYAGPSDITYRGAGVVSIGPFKYANEVDFYGVRIERLDMNTYFGLGEDSTDCVIVGNIFENPELLK